MQTSCALQIVALRRKDRRHAKRHRHVGDFQTDLLTGPKTQVIGQGRPDHHFAAMGFAAAARASGQLQGARFHSAGLQAEDDHQF